MRDHSDGHMIRIKMADILEVGAGPLQMHFCEIYYSAGYIPITISGLNIYSDLSVPRKNFCGNSLHIQGGVRITTAEIIIETQGITTEIGITEVKHRPMITTKKIYKKIK